MRGSLGLRVETLSAGPVTRQAIGRLRVTTPGPGFVDITRDIATFVSESGLRDGLACLFCRHTSASLTIQENADPDVCADLMRAPDRLAPHGARYRHASEGADDMPAHIRTLLTATSLQIPILAGELTLGRWQGVYLIEHRDRPHPREIVVNLNGA